MEDIIDLIWKMLQRIICVVIFLNIFSIAEAKFKMEPLVNIEYTYADSYYESNDSGWRSNFFIDGILGFNLSDKTAILPYFMAKHTGVQTLNELIGGKMLFQETLEYKYSLNLLHKWRKNVLTEIDIGYKKELLNETLDEDWGKGLYDHYNIYTGFDFIWNLSKTKFSLGYNYYRIRFPNYDTLASWVGFTQMGEYIHDFDANELNINYTRPLLGFLVNAEYNIIYENFINQYVYTSDMNYSTDKRQDLISDISVAVNFKPMLFSFSNITLNLIKNKTRRKLFPTLNIDFTYKNSNQNYIDSAAGVFLSDYYSYLEYGAGSQFNIYFSRKLSCGINYKYTYRHYPGRYVQIFSDTYDLSEHMNEQSHSLGISFYVPFIYNIKLKTEFNWKKNISNNIFSGGYQYNYNAYSFLTGFNWRY